MSTTALDRGRPREAEPTVVRALHIGRRDHYRLAAAVLARRPERVVLMQRSSTIVLGPENDWHDEGSFYEAVWASAATGAEWYHVVSTSGIGRHLARRASTFPRRADALARLTLDDDVVSIGAGASARPIKQLPVDHHTDDFKLDRQARMMAVDFGDGHEALVVTDIGDRQCSIHQCGPYARQLFELALEFWRECPPLRVGDVPVTS